MTNEAKLNSPIILASGGTGGHLFPAQALAAELKTRGHKLILLTDHRGYKFGGIFSEVEKHRIRSGTPLAPGLLGKGLGIIRLLIGIREAGKLLNLLQPSIVVGFGGYPSVPALIAASRKGITTVIHEQNAILGRANKLLASHVLCIATSFEDTCGISLKNYKKVTHTGNPIRSSIAELGKLQYPQIKKDGPINILVTGGSQGAGNFSELIPEAIKLLSPQIKTRIKINQNCRPEDLEKIRRNYRINGINADVDIFFDDLPVRLRAAHVVVCRAGASTLAELAAAGRPAIIFPYPYAADDHQTINSRSLEAVGGAIVLKEEQATSEKLADLLLQLFTSPEWFLNAAKAALKMGRPNASIDLADLVENMAFPGNSATTSGIRV